MSVVCNSVQSDHRSVNKGPKFLGAKAVSSGWDRLERFGREYQLGRAGEFKINNQGYANDMVIIAECLEALEGAFKVCEEFADWAGFQFHPGKCAIMSRKNSAGRVVAPASGSVPLRLCGEEVPVLEQGQF